MQKMISMFYLLHEASDLEKVEKDILPLFPENELMLKSFPLEKDFQPEKDSVLVLFLSDKILGEVILNAVKEEWKIAILPHKENNYTSKGLGLSNKMEDAVNQILECQKPQILDLLFCNGEPVFQSVNIGYIFALTQKESGSHIFSEVWSIIRKMRKVSSLSHQPFEITAGEENIINTSALGIVAVEHASSSVIATRLIEESSINDGRFAAFILSPQNLLSLLWFFLKSLLPRKKNLSKAPSFIGIVKAKDLTIKTPHEIEYTIDGKKFSSNTLHLEVQPQAIYLFQESSFFTAEGENGKKSLKIEGLPTGEAKDELVKRKLPILPRATSEQFADLFKILRKNSEINSAYVTMMILSTLIATFGLYGNSSPVIIGAMILAPIIAPIVSFSMGMVRYDVLMLKKGFITITTGTMVSLAIAAGVTLIIPLQIITPEIEARLSPTLLDLGIAVASGIAAAYAHAKEGIAKSLAGVAIAVALVPPLAVAGIGLGWMNWEVFSGAILLYATNLAGIIMFAGLTFLLLGYAPFKRAKMGLIYTLVIIGLVTIPLTLSFGRIMKEAQITKALEGITIDEIVLRDVKIRFGTPLVVSLKLVGNEAMEPDKIAEIKHKIEQKIEQPVVLEVVSAITF